MRPRLRSAYLSIRRNMKRLWTFYDYRDRVIPNTNNGLEAIFATSIYHDIIDLLS